MPNAQPHTVIVGGGFGGLECAKALGPTKLPITLIDRSNHHLFQPLLYQVATAGLSPADIAMPIRNILNRYQNIEVAMASINGVDVARKVLNTTLGELSFDFLVLATGARHAYFGHPEWEKNASGLKSIEDATRIRSRILLAFEAAEIEPDAERRRQLLTFVLVGGGPTGVEMAGAIAELANKALAADFRNISPHSAKIILVEAGPRLLASFPSHLSARATRDLLHLGVSVRLGVKVVKVDEQGVDVVTSQNAEERINSATVIWAAGVLASPVYDWLHQGGVSALEQDSAHRVVVTEELTIPGHPNIFVIGDAARVPTSDGAPLPGVCSVAMQEGRFVAKLIKRRARGKTRFKPFRYVDKGNLATIGRSSAIADFGRFTVTGWFAWFMWLAVHIYFLIGFRNRLLVIIQWAWAYITFQRGARLITQTTVSPNFGDRSAKP